MFQQKREDSQKWITTEKGKMIRMNHSIQSEGHGIPKISLPGDTKWF